MKKHKYVRTRTCLYCGKDFTYPAHSNNRRYCSRSCGSKASYNRGEPGGSYKVWGHNKSVFDAAMELYWSGEESGVISRKLTIPVGTIHSWIHDFGFLRERKEPLKKLLSNAKNAEEWLMALRENTQEASFDDMPVLLVCGTVHGYSVKRFTSIVFERLKDNPMSGKVYAFCSKTRTAITTFAWKPPVFNISKHIKMHGTFIWPGEDLGGSIEVTKDEFTRLLFLNKQEIISEKTARNLDIMRV